MATTVVTVDGSFYVLSTAVWERIYGEFLRCIKSCSGPKEKCVQGCNERLGFPDGSLRPGVTLGQVDWCFSVCEDNYDACLARCNAKYQEDVLDNALRVEPGAPPPFTDEVLAFKTPAGKRTLRELGFKMAVGGGIVSGAGLVLRTVFRTSPVAAAIGTATAVSGIVNGITLLLMKVIADDPPDPLYRTLWTPRTGVLTALSDFMSELDPVVVPLLEPIRNEARISIYAEAVAVSLERAAAATTAGHPDIARSHLVASFDYANVCASSLSRAKTVRAEAVALLPTSVRRMTVSRRELLAARRTVKERGFVRPLDSVITKLTKKSRITKKTLLEQLTTQPIPRDFSRTSVATLLKQTSRGSAERRTAAVFAEFAASPTR